MDFTQRTKIDALFAEFPRLSLHFNKSTISEVNVKRWDDKLLNIHPHSFYKEDNGFDYDCWADRSKIFLLDKDGALVAVIGERVPIVWWNPLSWLMHAMDRTDDERAYVEMLKMGEDVCRRVTFIVSLHKSSGTKNAGNKVPEGITLTAWKAPAKHENLAGWLKQQYDFTLGTQRSALSEN